MSSTGIPLPVSDQGKALRVLLGRWTPELLRAALDPLLLAWECEDLRAVIRIRWNRRLRTTVGRALLEDMVLELNPRLLARHPEELRSVLAHEAAHLVVRRLHGPAPAPHGKLWKAYMRRVGESTGTTHQLDTRGLRLRRRKRRSRRWSAAFHW